jgi:exosortase A-associated hydrolase 2
MIEEPFFFTGPGDCRLFGVFHQPPSPDATKPVFVFCHPLGEEKLWSHRTFVSYARRLADAGYPVLRFDLRGNGDSEGRFQDLTVDVACADIECAMAEAKRRSGAADVSLLGLRFGATLATLVAGRVPALRHLVLWAPVTHGERYLQELLRINVMTQLATYKVVRQERADLVAELQAGRSVNVDGYEMAWPLYESVAPLALGTAPLQYAGPTLVVQVDKQPRPSPDLQRLAEALPAATLAFAQEEPFWKEIAKFYQEAPALFQVTTEWLAGH